MSKITVRDLLMKFIDKYIKTKPQINQDLNDRKNAKYKGNYISNDNGMF